MSFVMDELKVLLLLMITIRTFAVVVATSKGVLKKALDLPMQLDERLHRCPQWGDGDRGGDDRGSTRQQ